MPTYEYTCRDCGHTFEVVQPMSDDPLTVCPICEGALRKVFAPPAIAFKGSGFYATDHGKKARKAETSAEQGTDSDKGKKKDDGSSSKDAKKADAKGSEGSSKGSGGSSSGDPSSSSGGSSSKKEATSS